MNQKGFISIAVVAVILIALAVSGYLVFVLKPKIVQAPSSDLGVADWKVYINTKYGFEFKYPKEWDTPRAYQRNGSTGTSLLGLGFGPTIKCCAGAPVEDSGDLDQYSIEVYPPGSPEITIPKFQEGFIKETTFIDTQKTIVYLEDSGNLRFPKGAWIFTKDYNLNFEAVNGDEQDVGKLFDQVLSTFKFTK